MIPKKIKAIFIALTIIGIAGLNAQNLNVLEKGGFKTPISIQNIKTLTFHSGSINVNLKIGSPLSFSLQSVRNISFALTTDVQDVESIKNECFQIFPNPANNFLNLIINSFNGTDAELKITSIEGRTVHTQKLNTSENNKQIINISTLANGIYYLVVNNGKTIYSKKFLKTN